MELVTTSYHLVFSELEYLSQADLEGAERFRVPTSKRVTFRTDPQPSKPRYTERRDSVRTRVDEPTDHSHSFDDQQDGDVGVTRPSDDPVSDPRFGRVPSGDDP